MPQNLFCKGYVVLLPMPWYLYMALKQLFPTRRGFSFFAVMSILGVSLGVAVLIGVQSVMNGFGREIRESLLKINGDIRIESDRVIYDWERLADFVEARDDVDLVSPYAHGVVMLQRGNLPLFPSVMGIDLTRERQLLPVDEFIRQGSLDDLDDDSVLLGSVMAQRIGATVGTSVELYTPLMLDRLKRDEVLLPREVTVAGIFESGRHDVDSSTLITSLRLMQDLYGMEDGIHGLALRLEPGASLEEATLGINEALSSPLRAVTWLETNREYAYVLEFEKTMMTIILFFIILVASFSITSALMTSVVRKTREIGLIVAMGARPFHVAMSYCVQGLIIGVSGTVIGIALQALILHYRNEIVWTFARLTDGRDAMLRFYQFNDIPVYYSMSDFVLVSGMTIIICLLAGILPAMRTLRMKPSDALRSE